MASKPSRTTDFSEQKKHYYWPNWVETFQKWKVKARTVKRWQKTAKAWEKILTKFNSQNLNGVKRDLSQLQGCWRRLIMKLQSKKEHDLHRHEERKTGGGKARGVPSD